MTDALSYLRQRTRAQHAELEGIPVFSAIMQSTVSIDDVSRLLRVLYRFHAAHEAPLRRLLANSAAAPLYLPRQAVLANCLQGLGCTLPEPPPQTLDLSSLAYGLGALYVIEGSTLGGSLIARHCCKMLPASVHPHLTYFSSLAENVGQHWQAVTTSLCLLLTEPEAQSQAGDSACAVFSTLQDLARQTEST